MSKTVLAFVCEHTYGLGGYNGSIMHLWPVVRNVRPRFIVQFFAHPQRDRIMSLHGRSGFGGLPFLVYSLIVNLP